MVGGAEMYQAACRRCHHRVRAEQRAIDEREQTAPSTLGGGDSPKPSSNSGNPKLAKRLSRVSGEEALLRQNA